MDDRRPDPDDLLERVRRDEERTGRGRLKVFFGGCAGVGKTYAMLRAARERQAKGDDVVAGVVETHGRPETGELLEGIEVLPPRRVEIQGRSLSEFDLDAALARKPGLLLVDELAHSNLAGSRHPKRWNDVEELLAAGIDVYTTLNVQHLESLNDVVGQITGIRVRETVPDGVFEGADEVGLVDLTPDDLIQRLREGKVYLPGQAETAIRNFFRKGNLIALRELALRRTADRVDAQMRDYRADQAIDRVWQAKERLLACVGPGPDGERVVRNAARLAASLRADLIAVYVETPELQRQPDADRVRILDVLRLAQRFGAETQTLSGADLVGTLLSYARGRNVSKLVVGRSSRSRISRAIRPSIPDALAAASREVDIFLVGKEDGGAPIPGGSPAAPEPLARRRGAVAAGIARASAVCAAVTLLGFAAGESLAPSNVVMVYLFGVVVVSYRYGRVAGIAASVLSVAAFDFFFVPPRLSFTVSDTQYLLTFAVMLAVTLGINKLASDLRWQARVATARERRAEELSTMVRALASALTVEQIARTGIDHVGGVFGARVTILLPDSRDRVRPWGGAGAGAEEGAPFDPTVSQWVYDNQEAAGPGTDTLSSAAALHVPLRAPVRTRGVLSIVPDDPRRVFAPEQRQLLDTFAAQIAIALERVHYVEVARDAVVRIEAERLRNTLLSAISHDVRTPLTSIVGLASALCAPTPLTEEARKDLASAIHEEALRMSGLVANLLDMARLQSGSVTLDRQWQPVEEVVGSALRACRVLLEAHHVVTEIPAGLPLVKFDAVLIERVLCNLLENAAKFAPKGTGVTIRADHDGERLTMSVADEGPGLPAGMEERIFDKFTRGEAESAMPGVGLGLAICRAIVEVHHGTIRAENRATGGAVFTFTIPTGTPPPMVPEGAP